MIPMVNTYSGKSKPLEVISKTELINFLQKTALEMEELKNREIPRGKWTRINDELIFIPDIKIDDSNIKEKRHTNSPSGSSGL